MNLIRWTIAATIFAILAYLPWHYWETARHVMRHEVSGRLGMDAQSAASIWWLMGISLIIWLPVSLLIAWGVSRAFLRLTKREPQKYNW
jgi:hypothetical protein